MPNILTMTQNQAFDKFLAECNIQQAQNEQRVNTMINHENKKHIDWNKVICTVILVLIIGWLFISNLIL